VLEDEFEDYVRARAGRLRRAAFALCGDWHHAEDLVQTALVKAHPALVSGRAEQPDAYVARTLINSHRSWRRRLWNGERPVASLPEPATAAPDDTGVALRLALRGLSRAHREVLALRFLLDLSEQHTARVLGVSAGTVKSRTARALCRLRELPGVQDLQEVHHDR
jgi:RNA polymerase sigma-70 factor (sigma-E family)